MTRSDAARQVCVLRLFPPDWHQPRRSGKGWMTLCPFHEDHTPSFFVSEGPRGWLWYCMAGCGGGSSIDFWLKLHGGTVSEAIRELLGPDSRRLPAMPTRPKRYTERERTFLLACDGCGGAFRVRDGRGVAVVRMATVGKLPELIDLARSLGWRLFRSAIFCPACPMAALRHAYRRSEAATSENTA